VRRLLRLLRIPVPGDRTIRERRGQLRIEGAALRGTREQFAQMQALAVRDDDWPAGFRRDTGKWPLPEVMELASGAVVISRRAIPDVRGEPRWRLYSTLHLHPTDAAAAWLLDSARDAQASRARRGEVEPIEVGPFGEESIGELRRQGPFDRSAEIRVRSGRVTVHVKAKGARAAGGTYDEARELAIQVARRQVERLEAAGATLAAP
jgi:hypothetical protein